MAALFNFAPQVPPISSVTEGITATPGGTQAAGVALTSRFNRISVCATGGDSVVLPPMQVDIPVYIANDGAASLNVFPYSGQSIGSAAVNAAQAIAAGKGATFTGSGTSGKWFVNLSA
jgi:hypothetical protein